MERDGRLAARYFFQIFAPLYSGRIATPFSVP